MYFIYQNMQKNAYKKKEKIETIATHPPRTDQPPILYASHPGADLILLRPEFVHVILTVYSYVRMNKINNISYQTE